LGRVDEHAATSPDLHQRIAARAAREGRSVNQLASDILDTAADADRGGLACGPRRPPVEFFVRLWL